MTKLPHSQLMEQLKSQHQVIAELISQAPVVYLDVPFYRNVGDLLIMQGTLAFFKNNNITMRFAASWFNTPVSRIKKDDVIVFQGGGNLGDLYFGCQHLRETLIPKFSNNRVIILPQSIHFKDPAKYQQCCEIFSKHPDLHLCVRDKESYALASKMTKHVYLLPDMAHQLYPLKTQGTVQHKTLGLLRKDIEVNRTADPAEVDTHTDWNLMFTKRNHLLVALYRLSRLAGLIGLNPIAGPVFTKSWFKAANWLTNDAIKLYSQHENIITDRLHGHILACLLDKPNTVLDNSYGKNSRYMAVWTEQSELVRRIPSTL